MPITRSRNNCYCCTFSGSRSLGAYIRIGAVVTLGVYIGFTIWELDRRSKIVFWGAPSDIHKLTSAELAHVESARMEARPPPRPHFHSKESAGESVVSNVDTSISKRCKHVKIVSAGKDNGNRADFWLEGKRLVTSESSRGLNVVLIDPVSQAVISFQTYDLYDDNAGPAKEKLAIDIEALKPGTIVLMGLMDTGLENLDAGMFELMQDSLGARISKGSFRTGYALITAKCSSKCEGTSVAEHQSPSAEVSGVLPCMERWTTPKPVVAKEDEHVNATCKRAKIRILSAGKDNGNVASFYINGKQIRGKPSTRGMNIVTLDPRDAKVIWKRAYDTWEQVDTANEKLFDDVEKVPEGTIVLAAAMDSGMENLDSYALDALQSCGAVIWQGKFRTGYALIGVKGGKAVAEKMAPSVELKGELPCPPRTYPKQSAAQKVETLERSDEVLFVVVSDSKFYGTRVKWLLDTWGRDVPDGDLMIVADKAGKLPVKLVETDCNSGNHDVGCCKFGHAVFAASKHLETDPKLEWFYFADDDVYVRPIHMKRRLAKRRVTKWPVAKGLLGCSNDKCHGICGGGGFLLNRKGLLKLVGNHTLKSFVDKYMKSCLYCSHWGDLAVSKMILDKGVKLENMQGLHPWRLDKTNFIDQLRSAHPPVTFHYMRNLEQLETLHKMFSPSRESGQVGAQHSNKVENDKKYACINYHGEKVCAQSGADPHVPWR
mmetsp:Transcript_112417/g.177752  ORF Transcript_112417/g.177752 Transcript_112417/m.177752 type:complete len:715 (-) Transcript_112417:60-2204(-)